MFVQRHPQRTCYHHHHQPQHHHSRSRQAASSSSSVVHQPTIRKPAKLPSSSTQKPDSESTPSPLENLDEVSGDKEVNLNLKVKSKSYNWLSPSINTTLNRVKLKRSESLPARLAISLLHLEQEEEEAKKRLSCDQVLLGVLKRTSGQSTGCSNLLNKAKSGSLDCLKSGARQEASSLSSSESSAAIENSGFISKSLKNIWGFSYFWFDFVAYQIQTWRLIAEHTLPINKQTPNTVEKLVESKCVSPTTHENHHSGHQPIAVPVVRRINEMSHSASNNPATLPNLMSFNDYYLPLTNEDKRPVEYPTSLWDNTMLDTRMRPRSRMGARNPLYRNLSLNVEAIKPHSTYYQPTAEYYPQHPQRPHSSRDEYPSTESPSSGSAGLNYHHRFYHQHFSADSITNGNINNNNNRAYPTAAKQLHSPQLQSPRPLQPRHFHTSNRLSVADAYGHVSSSDHSQVRPNKAARRSPTTMNSCEHHSSALNSLDYTTDETPRSLPMTKVELCHSRQPEVDSAAMGERHFYLPRAQYQHQAATIRRQHPCERPNSSMSYQRTYSEAADPRTIARHCVESVAGPRIRSDSDLARNRTPEGNNGAHNSSSLWPKGGEHFYHIHHANHTRSHEKLKSVQSSGGGSNQPPTETITKSNRSPQQISTGSRKQNSSSLKLSLTGAKKRLGFKQSGSTALIVQRSEEILPSQPNSFFSHQLDNYSPSSSCDTNHSFFIEGLGPGQIVSRQGLVSPYLGDIQLTLTDRRGMLEVEVVRARRLQMKAGADCPPAPYVKIYLMKDKKCISKWKTSTVVRTLDPLYQELFIFREDYAHCILQVIVWGYYGKKDKKSLMGVAQIHLNDVDISNLVIGWYKLFNAPSMTNSLHSSKNLRKMLTKNLTIAN